MPRRRGRLDLTALTALALLLHGPRHPYELHRLVLETHKDYITGLPRSLYHAVDRLAADELIVPVETSREGRRPERTVYEITEEGRAELAGRIRQLLERPASDTTLLYGAISLMGVLAPLEAERALRTRAAVLEGKVTGADATLVGLRATGLQRVLLLELECERALNAAELDWCRGLADELAAESLTWAPAMPGTALPDVGETDGSADGEGGTAGASGPAPAAHRQLERR